MVKKIKLDFSKVEERSGWNTKIIPEGIYKMKIVGVEDNPAGDGTDMLTYALVPEDRRYAARRFPYYCKIQPNQMFKIRDLLVAAGQTVPKKAQLVDPNSPVGKYVAVEVGDGTGQYSNRSEINGVYGLDVLDEDGNDSDSDDEDEEYEGDEEETDEPDEEEEEDEEEDDLSTMTLVELRKLAKSLGIDTTGLKKDDLIESIEEEQEAEEDEEDDEDEDEDLDDEELYDDEEDEEEEEAPAPKRRAAAKAPAKKAAAPAKRVVKRR